MALCDYLIDQDINGYNCASPSVKGAKPDGLLINRADINFSGVAFDTGANDFTLTALPLKSGKQAYNIVQSGKTPYNGTQQEVVEGTYVNTFTNTVQFVILAQNDTTAEQIFALMNGEFVVILKDNIGNYQVYGLESGLHASAMAREIYNDDTLSGWQVTMVEENAPKGNVFINSAIYESLIGE